MAHPIDPRLTPLQNEIAQGFAALAQDMTAAFDIVSGAHPVAARVFERPAAAVTQVLGVEINFTAFEAPDLPTRQNQQDAAAQIHHLFAKSALPVGFRFFRQADGTPYLSFDLPVEASTVTRLAQLRKNIAPGR